MATKKKKKTEAAEDFPALWEVTEFHPLATIGGTRCTLRKGAILRTARVGQVGIERLKAQGVKLKPFKG